MGNNFDSHNRNYFKYPYPNSIPVHHNSKDAKDDYIEFIDSYYLTTLFQLKMLNVEY